MFLLFFGKALFDSCEFLLLMLPGFLLPILEPDAFLLFPFVFDLAFDVLSALIFEGFLFISLEMTDTFSLYD